MIVVIAFTSVLFFNVCIGQVSFPWHSIFSLVIVHHLFYKVQHLEINFHCFCSTQSSNFTGFLPLDHQEFLSFVYITCPYQHKPFFVHTTSDFSHIQLLICFSFSDPICASLFMHNNSPYPSEYDSLISSQSSDIQC